MVRPRPPALFGGFRWETALVDRSGADLAEANGVILGRLSVA